MSVILHCSLCKKIILEGTLTDHPRRSDKRTKSILCCDTCLVRHCDTCKCQIILPIDSSIAKTRLIPGSHFIITECLQCYSKWKSLFYETRAFVETRKQLENKNTTPLPPPQTPSVQHHRPRRRHRHRHHHSKHKKILNGSPLLRQIVDKNIK